MTPCAVRVSNGCKSYSAGEPVLKDMFMQVEHGKIYGLLGESGCGKTTLLKCIMGQIALDSGHISVLERDACRSREELLTSIGHMPQEVALYPLRIREIFEYFGTLQGLSKIEVGVRIRELSTVLNLEDGNLSRRTASSCLACCRVVKSPQTFDPGRAYDGIDPLLRLGIWDYIGGLVVTLGTTVIVTTHYAEEARKSVTISDSMVEIYYCGGIRFSWWWRYFSGCGYICTTKPVTIAPPPRKSNTAAVLDFYHFRLSHISLPLIGIMRRGRLICEDNPNNLLESYGTPILEVVLKSLARMDEEKKLQSIDNHSTLAKISRYKYPLAGLESDKCSPLSFRFKEKDETEASLENIFIEKAETPKKSKIVEEFEKVRILTKRNYLLHLRTPEVLATFLLLPVIQVIAIFYIFGRDPVGMRLAVYNQERNCFGGKNNMNYSLLGDNWTIWGCAFLKELEEGAGKFNLKYYRSGTSALAAVETGGAIGAVEIPANFTVSTRHRFVFDRFTPEIDLRQSTIKVRMDMTNTINTNFVISMIQLSYMRFLQGIVNETRIEINPNLLKLPFTFNRKLDPHEFTFQEYILPANVICKTTFFLSMSAGIFLSTEKEQGTLARSLAAGVKMRQVYISYFISETSMTILQVGAIFAVQFALVGYGVRGNLGTCFVMALLSSVVTMSLAMLAASIFSKLRETIVTIIFFILICGIPSGSFWPLEAVNAHFRWMFYYLNPISLPMVAMRRVFNNGWGLGHLVVRVAFLTPIAWLVLISCGYCVVGRIQRVK
ncbi:ABC transporter G family member 20 [Folsomia candida]|uniref:ABC transporter G family member 20 n=1 Tax=Folsomia candida TaxID=158441 RepID=A0A226DD98_FOLCA|nr:ABC transporter G family member 20 [Folsomia candida]